MRTIKIVNETLREKMESQMAIFATLFYECNENKTAYVFADGRLIEVVLEHEGEKTE